MITTTSVDKTIIQEFHRGPKEEQHYTDLVIDELPSPKDEIYVDFDMSNKTEHPYDWAEFEGTQNHAYDWASIRT